MITEYNWYTHNLLDKIGNPLLQFKVDIKPYNFNGHLDFKQACDKAACTIRNNYPKIYLALSGGIDSCFVFEVLKRNGVPFTPYIVRFHDGFSNDSELIFALKQCKEHGIKPEIIDITAKELLEIYVEKVYKTIEGNGIVSTSNIILAEKAKKDGAILIQGEHILNDMPFFPIIYTWGAAEYDVYSDLVDTNVTISFYLYSLEILNAMLKASLDNKIAGYDLKIKLYGMDRPKVRMKVDSKLDKIYGFYSFQQYAMRKYCGLPNTKALYDSLAPWRVL